ncbi:hypothetical protein RSAG8_03506, partial [Rhizoctonia solani AG-8 WAC10335]
MNLGELRSTGLRIKELVELVQERVKLAPMPKRCNSGGKRPAQRGKQKADYASITQVVNQVQDNNQAGGYDGDYAPDTGPESSGEELDMEVEKEFGIMNFGNTGHQEKRPDMERRASSPMTIQPEEPETIGITQSDEAPRPGRDAAKGRWVMTHYNDVPKPRVRKNGVAIWGYNCKWCRPMQHTTHPGTLNWDEETKDRRNFVKSNFITHIEKRCRLVPKDQKLFDEIKAQGFDKSAGANSRVLASGTPMSQREFNGNLAKAIVRDNHSMTFGEGDGMIEFFQKILPGIRLPTHQTLTRHLYRLFDVLSNKVKDNLKSVERHAISTDAWSSKNSVYSLAGVISFSSPTRTENFGELVIDVINLDADHSGNRMGGLVYSALKTKGVANRAIACVTDNASANSVMNDTLAMRIRAHSDVHAHGKTMSFTCVAHAIHLICTDLMSHLGVIEPGDHFPEVKGTELEDDSDDVLDPELDTHLGLDEESDSDLDDDLLAEIAPELTLGDDGKPVGKGRQPKALTVTQKIHEIVVYATASPKRQKQMRQIIAKTCTKDVSHLFLKKSVRTRWGSARAEAKRAIELRPAVISFVANLDSTRSRSGKSRKQILKLQEHWNITGEEWDLLGMVVNILTPFHAATEAMSRRDVATISDVIPTFALLERKLLEAISQLQGEAADHKNTTARALLSGLEAALAKLQKYQTLAHKNHLCLIATVLNPWLRLKYLEKWPESHSTARTLVSYIFENYHAKLPGAPAKSADRTMHSRTPKLSKLTTTWDHELYSDTPSFTEHFDRELQAYYSGSYPCTNGTSTLNWWEIHHLHFPTVAHMARDFLCIPASSVSVERLFSSCKLTMTDVRSSMSFETARRRICCQNWMKVGVDTDAIRMALEIDESTD